MRGGVRQQNALERQEAYYCTAYYILTLAHGLVYSAGPSALPLSRSFQSNKLAKTCIIRFVPPNHKYVEMKERKVLTGATFQV